MKQQLGKWLSIILPVGLGLFLIVYTYQQFSSEQIEEIKSQFREADYKYIWLSLVFGIITLWSRAYRWQFTLEPMGFQTKFANRFMAVIISYFVNMSIPRSGEVSRAFILKKYEEVPFDKGFGTIIAERVVDSLFLLSFIVLALVLQFDVVKTFVLDKIPLHLLLIVGVFGLLFLIVFFWVLKTSQHKKILWFKQKISGFMEGLKSITKMKKRGAFLLHSCVIWIGYVLMFYVTIFALPETSELPFGAVIAAFVVGGIAITLTNSGFGAYPFMISKILLLYGVAETSGNTFGWIVWSAQTLMIVVLGTLSFLLLPLVNRSK
ncbi:MAG: YbhN family protein [Flavobacterium sp.]